MAANAGPEALRHAEAARTLGASEASVGVALAIGRTLRGKAQGFSDAEIDRAQSQAEAEAALADPGGGAGGETATGCGCI